MFSEKMQEINEKVAPCEAVDTIEQASLFISLHDYFSVLQGLALPMQS